MSSPRPLISIVVPCYNEAEVFGVLRGRLQALAESTAGAFDLEFLFVDDGSSDDTWSAIAAFSQADPRVRGLRLSRNFGHQFALSCGYQAAAGRAVVSIDADLQDPPELVPEMVQLWKQGVDVVYAVRREREGETLFKRVTAKLFYRFMRLIGARRVRMDTGDFRLLSRRALDGLNRLGEYHRFVRGMVGWIGFREAEVYYTRSPRAAGESKYPFRKMLRLALDAAVSFSMIPLRLAYLSSFILALLLLGYLGYVAIKVFVFHENPIRGWTSVILATMAFGSINLFCLGIMGEYVGRIFEQVKARPLYLVSDVVGDPPASD